MYFLKSNKGNMYNIAR